MGNKLFSRVLMLFLVVCFMSGFFKVERLYADDALCRGSFINPLTEVRWDAIFPITLAGIKIKGGADMDDPEGTGTDFFCFCKKGTSFVLGITVTYWNPVRIIETTKIPWCFPTLGMKLSMGDSWKHMGTYSSGADESFTFTNAHNLITNWFDILNIFMDVPCVPHEGFDVAYFSELDPSWNSDMVAYFMNPEALLFGNPVAQLACTADSTAAASGWPIDSLFWCAGGWGSVYPFTGYNSDADYTMGNALNMARVLFRNARVGVMWDTGVDECGAVTTPIWIKTHFKVHEIRPVRGEVMPIGRPVTLWEYSKNPPGGTSKGSQDNFSWQIFKFVKCCLGYSSSN